MTLPLLFANETSKVQHLKRRFYLLKNALSAGQIRVKCAGRFSQ